jgi:hypothetical protein
MELPSKIVLGNENNLEVKEQKEQKEQKEFNDTADIKPQEERNKLDLYSCYFVIGKNIEELQRSLIENIKKEISEILVVNEGAALIHHV